MALHFASRGWLHIRTCDACSHFSELWCDHRDPVSGPHLYNHNRSNGSVFSRNFRWFLTLVNPGCLGQGNPDILLKQYWVSSTQTMLAQPEEMGYPGELNNVWYKVRRESTWFLNWVVIYNSEADFRLPETTEIWKYEIWNFIIWGVFWNQTPRIKSQLVSLVRCVIMGKILHPSV